MFRISGKKVSLWLAERGLTGQKLALKTDLDRDTVYRIIKSAEAGKAVREDTLGAIANALDVDIEELLVDKDLSRQTGRGAFGRAAGSQSLAEIQPGASTKATNSVPVPGPEIVETSVQAQSHQPASRPAWTDLQLHDWQEWLEPFDFTPFLQAMEKMLVHRDQLLGDLTAWMESGNERVCLVAGASGCGKTALLADLVRRNPAGRILAYHFCDDDMPRTKKAGPFVQSIAAMLARNLPEYAEQLHSPRIRDLLGAEVCRRDPWTCFDQAIVAPLHRVQPPAQGSCVLLVDGADLCCEGVFHDKSIYRTVWFRLDRLPNWLKVILTDRNPNRSAGEAKLVRILLDSEENLATIEKYVDLRLADARLQHAMCDAKMNRKTLLHLLFQSSGGELNHIRSILDGVSRGCHLTQPSSWPRGTHVREGDPDDEDSWKEPPTLKPPL